MELLSLVKSIRLLPIRICTFTSNSFFTPFRNFPHLFLCQTVSGPHYVLANEPEAEGHLSPLWLFKKDNIFQSEPSVCKPFQDFQENSLNILSLFILHVLSCCTALILALQTRRHRRICSFIPKRGANSCFGRCFSVSWGIMLLHKKSELLVLYLYPGWIDYHGI